MGRQTDLRLGPFLGVLRRDPRQAPGLESLGAVKKKQDGSRRFWTWSCGAAGPLLWTGLAFWRMLTLNPYNFIVLFALGLFELVVVGRVLLQPRAGYVS